MKDLIVVSYSPKDTEIIGKAIGKVAPSGSVVLLEGELGCGKTCMTRGIVSARGINGEEVSSPSFTIVQEYGDVVHIDLYRLSSQDDVVSIGIEDYLYDGSVIKVIEWPEVLSESFDLFPFSVIRVICSFDGDKRIFKIYAGENLLFLIEENLLSGGVDVQNS